MRSKGLVVMAAAGLCVVAYAFYTLLDSGSSRTELARRSEPGRSSDARGRSSRSADAEGDRSQERRDGKRRPAAVRPTVRVSPPPEPGDQAQAGSGAVPGAPPRPEPEMSLEEARKQYSDLVAELDRLAAEGVTLTSPQWVDYYKRGNDALLPLQQHLDWSVPDEAAELRQANEDMRAKLRAIEPGSSAAAPPP